MITDMNRFQISPAYSKYKEKILKLLVDVKNDNPKRFGDKINMLIERTV